MLLDSSTRPLGDGFHHLVEVRIGLRQRGDLPQSRKRFSVLQGRLTVFAAAPLCVICHSRAVEDLMDVGRDKTGQVPDGPPLWPNP